MGNVLPMLNRVFKQWKQRNQIIAVKYMTNPYCVDVCWVGKRKYRPTYAELMEYDIEWIDWESSDKMDASTLPNPTSLKFRE